MATSTPTWRSRARQIVGLYGAVIAATVVIGLLTLSPSTEAGTEAPFPCLLRCGSDFGRDLLQNVLLFVPFGAALRQHVGWLKVLALGVCFTMFIEAAQFQVVPGRDASLGDIFANSVGTAVGAWLGERLTLFRSPGQLGLRLTMGAAGGWLALLLLTGWLLRPVNLVPPLEAGLGVPLPSYMSYPGTLLSATIAGVKLAPGETVRIREWGDTLAYQVLAASGRPSGTMAPLFWLQDGTGQPPVVVGQVGARLAAEVPTRAVAWGFRPLVIAVNQVSDLSVGDTLVIDGTWSGRAVNLAARHSGQGRDTEVLPRIGWFWILIMPFRYTPGAGTPWITAVWMAGMLIPAGYWAAWGRPTTWATLVLFAVLILAVLPGLLGLAPAGAPEWLGSTGGLVGSGLAGRRLAGQPQAKAAT